MDRRETVKVGDVEFLLRLPRQRDLHIAFQDVAILPTRGLPAGSKQEAIKRIGESVSESLTVGRAAQVLDNVLCRCSRRPRIVMDDLADPPDGVIPVSELTDDEYAALTRWVSERLGWTEEASAEIVPLSEDGTGS